MSSCPVGSSSAPTPFPAILGALSGWDCYPTLSVGRRRIVNVARPLVFAVCQSGPYRFLGDLFEEHHVTWFPWGYRVRQLTKEAQERIVRGTTVELWQVDDVRTPATASPLALAKVDYITHTQDYVAMTLRRVSGKPQAPPSSVLTSVREGALAFAVVSESKTRIAIDS
jgi:hypothetical protein